MGVEFLAEQVGFLLDEFEVFLLLGCLLGSVCLCRLIQDVLRLCIVLGSKLKDSVHDVAVVGIMDDELLDYLVLFVKLAPVVKQLLADVPCFF